MVPREVNKWPEGRTFLGMELNPNIQLAISYASSEWGDGIVGVNKGAAMRGKNVLEY